MIIQALKASFKNMLSPEFHVFLLKISGITVLLLIGIWLGFQHIAAGYFSFIFDDAIPAFPSWFAWLSTVFAIFAAIGSALILAFLIAPVTAFIAGFFIDDIARKIEQKHYPNIPPGHSIPLSDAIMHSLKFLMIILFGNLFALLLFFIPGVNLFSFFIVNGYLLGREYFELAALRHHGLKDVKALRSRYGKDVFLSGLIIAVFLSIPFVNFFTPFFATSMMVHLHKMILARDKPHS